MFCKAFAAIVLTGFLALPAEVGSKDSKSKKDTVRAKEAVAEAAMPDLWPRETGPGHQPSDLNGDGVLSRDEWAGDDAVFRRLDRNGDGVLSEADRKLTVKDKRVHKPQGRTAKEKR